ncbi:MAG TPA: hypothetical protein VJ960_06115, partial [Oceanipulchritudo sp.]|nr:hypothetical protein [Oceanipulchritudo sp.]
EIEFSTIARAVSVTNGVLFAGCDSGYLVTTTDGLNWDEVRIRDSGFGSSYGVEHVSHFNGYYFAAGGNGLLARSVDLSNWETIPLGGSTATFKTLLYFNNRYIILPVRGSRVLFSEDLTVWTDDRRVPVIRATGGWIFEDQIVVSSLGGLYTSTDGASFIEHPLPSAGFRMIIFDGSQYVGAGGAAVIATTGSLPLSTLQLTIDGNGTVERSPDQALYDTSTLVRLTASPADGEQFLWWETAEGVDQSSSIDLVLSSDTNVTAIFAGVEPPALDLSASPDNLALQWPKDGGWRLYQSGDLIQWSQSPDVESSGDQSILDSILPGEGNLFFQFRLREP